MDYWERKKRLKYGVMSAIARKLNRSVQDVSEHLKGHRHNRRVQRELARAMGLRIAEAFPDTMRKTHADHATDAEQAA